MNTFEPKFRSGLPGASGPTEAAAGAGDQLPVIRQYLRIAYRWRYILGGSVAVCLLLGLIVTFLMRPQYTATTTVEIARESNKITDIQGVERDSGIGDQEFYQTQYGLLRAQSLAERVAVQLRLPDDPAFFTMFGDLPDRPEFTMTNGRLPAAGRELRVRAAGELLLKRVVINPTRLSRLVAIGVTTPNAAFSAKVANAWTTNFIQATLERRFQATSYARNFLENRLSQLRERLEVSERQLVAYAGKEQIINLPGPIANGQTSERSIAADDLASFNSALAAATSERIATEARARVGVGDANAEGLRNMAINNLRQKRAELNADYQKLMTQFEPGYPAAQALASQIAQLDKGIAREEGRVQQSLQTDYRQAASREALLKNRVAGLKSNVLDLRRRSIQYNIFQRDVDTNRALYDGLLQRYKEIGVAGGIGVNNVSIVDPAQAPKRPSSPKLLLNLLASLVLGVAIGAGLAFVLEQSDEAVVDPNEVETMIGLPLLGSIPKVDIAPKNALLDRKSELVDAYLAVQTNLEFTTEHGIPRTLAVTSTRPSEGKSTTSLALATMLARANRKVVLIDGDMRSPSIHQLGNVSHDVGLSNFLAGGSDVQSLLFTMKDLGVTAMTAGPIPPNAAELLTGDRLPLLFNELLKSFDHIIVDSPPVMGLADAPLIGSRVEAVVYAVESHGIRASLVRTALARLAAANARVIGAVVTKFESRKAHLGYGYEYGYGYGRDDQAAAKRT